MADYDSFDYIIVGGGTAGLVLATRLTEELKTTVCVLEAGEDRTNEQDIRVPGFASKNIGRPDMHWLFSTVPQKNAHDRSIILPRGKALGGSSTANFLSLGRGNAEEYDALERLGNDGWNWASMLPYFKKSETYTVTPEEGEKFHVRVNPEYHGTNGPIHRTLPKWTPDTHGKFIKALDSLGVPYNADPTNGDNKGVWASNHAIHPTEAIRSAAASSYYEPVKDRTNLHVITGAYVTRILITKREGDQNLVAEGVAYIKDGENTTLRARKEVLLCAGTYQTPQLLELSGVGDKNILEMYGIPSLLDLPNVGKNLQDHYWVWITFQIDPHCDSLEMLDDPARFAKEWELYEKSKTGVFAHIAFSALAFLAAHSFVDEKMMEKLAREADMLVQSSEYSKLLGVQKEWLLGNKVAAIEIGQNAGFIPPSGEKPEPGKRYVSLMLSTHHSFSRGTVHITSSDPLVPPAIDPRLFDNDIDMDLLVEGMKYIRKLVSTYGDIVIQEVQPGPEVQSDEQLKELIRKTVLTVFHPIGTASMLPREDGGVVDNELKVYGTANLRVVDASILPVHVSGHPVATIYAIAEKAADIIKNNKD